MKHCLNCRLSYRHSGNFCSIECKEKKAIGMGIQYNRKQALETERWKTYWAIRFRGNILQKERKFYEEYNYLLRTERFNKK